MHHAQFIALVRLTTIIKHLIAITWQINHNQRLVRKWDSKIRKEEQPIKLWNASPWGTRIAHRTQPLQLVSTHEIGRTFPAKHSGRKKITMRSGTMQDAFLFWTTELVLQLLHHNVKTMKPQLIVKKTSQMTKGINTWMKIWRVACIHCPRIKMYEPLPVKFAHYVMIWKLA